MLTDGQVPCPAHPHQPATAACSHCGRFACDSCFEQVDGRQVCTTCVSEGRVRPATPLPWEQRAELGIAAAAWRTIVEVGLRPRSLFRGMREDGSVGEALGFAVLANLPAGIAIGLLYAVAVLVIGFAIPGVAEEFGGDEGPVFLVIMVLVCAMAGLLIPLLMVSWVAFFSVVHHGTLAVLGATTKPLSTTLRVALYASGVQFWGVIVCLQMAYVPLIWSMVSTGIGYQEVHRTQGWQAALAVVLPYLMCCGAYIAFYGFLFAIGELP